MIKKSTKKGFSLVELLVVITIIAILSVVAYSAIAGNTVKARDAKRKQDLTTIQSAFELYFLKNNRYPDVLETGVEGGLVWRIPKIYLSAIPADPSGKAYVYKIAGDYKTYEIAASMENDGILTNFSSYVVGNGTSLVLTIAGSSNYNPGTGNLTSCLPNLPITNGDVIGQAPNIRCIPYDPRPL